MGYKGVLVFGVVGFGGTYLSAAHHSAGRLYPRSSCPGILVLRRLGLQDG